MQNTILKRKTDLMKKINFTLTKLKVAYVVGLALMVSSTFSTAQAQECTVSATATNLPVAIDPPAAPGGNYPGFVEIAGIPADETLVEVTVDFSLDHSWTSDLDLSVTAPSGQTIVLDAVVCGFNTMSSANTITYDDNGAAIICGDPLPTQISIPDNLLSTLVLANTSELNGPWSVTVNDHFAGCSGGTYTSGGVNVTVTGECAVAPACEITCPDDAIINLDAGECCMVYNYAIGGDPALCGSEPIEGFTGPFDGDNTVTEVNTPTAPTAPLDLTGECGGGVTEDQTSMCSNDFFNDPSCPYVFTIYSWIIPESGTVSFDWDYNTNDASPGWDPFGTGLIIGPNIFFTDIYGGFLDGTSNSGSVSLPFIGGQEMALYIRSLDGWGGQACVDISNFVFTPNALLDINQTAGPENGTCLEIGSHDFSVEITAADGSVTNCDWTVDVVGYGNPTTTLACNDNVQVSVDENCNAVIGSDMILEGGPYNCYDEYYVEIENFGGNLGSVTINGSAVGQQLSVTISDPSTGNSCWGYINVEDKLPPMISCEDVTLSCGVSTDPVYTPVVGGEVSAGQSNNTPIPDADPAGIEESVEINIPNGASVGNVTVDVEITHTFSGDLNVTITSPSGDVLTLANGVCGGTNDWDVTFDDEGHPLQCFTGPALFSTAQPQGGTLASISSVAEGTWTLYVSDNVGADIGNLTSWAVNVEWFFPQASAPTASDNCGDPELTYTDSQSGEDCEDLTITRTWVATDASGNTASCEQIISITPLDLTSLECPEAYIGDDCDESIHPDNTGYPTVGGVEVDGGSVCNIFLDYWDKPLTACGNGTKIIRTWTVLDWCTQEVEECVQVIKLPAAGPVLNCPDNITVGSDPWFCLADVNLPHPGVYEPCGGSAYTLSVESTQGEIVSFGSYYRVDNLPLGETRITWTAEDECGNSSTCHYTITVEDDVPPVALCDEHTIVSLTHSDNRITKVKAETFDDG